jgi:hypothetical protein
MRMNPLALLTAAIVALAPSGAAFGQGSEPDISLSAPVACPSGMVCPVQNLFDHDPGKSVRDFRCTALSYDGHDGTDVRAPSLAAQRAGINVRAAAEGVVLGARDGMADVGIAGAGREALKDVECGNGVLLRHAGGWDTQYCHMAQGSIAVKRGDSVARGQVLGRIGLSGMTEFPHLHFALRRNGKPVDPYAIDGAETCGAGRSVWSPEAAVVMQPDAPLVLNAGFAAGPVPNEAIESGAAEAQAPGKDPAALVVYGRVIGLSPGDAVRVTLLGPGGAELARNDVPPAPKPKAQWSAYAGRKRPPQGWPAGAYRGRVEILRDGKGFKATEIALEFGG